MEPGQLPNNLQSKESAATTDRIAETIDATIIGDPLRPPATNAPPPAKASPLPRPFNPEKALFDSRTGYRRYWLYSMMVMP